MLLIDDGRGAVTAAQVRMSDRIHARVHADRLDRELAAGASPDASVELALRAQALTTDRARRTLARGLRLAISATRNPAGPPAASLNRAAIRAAAGDIAELAGRLSSPGPVSVWGVAQAEMLLTDGAGALRDRRRASQLRATVRRATEALAIDAAPAVA